METRASVDMTGDLAAAFLAELGARIAEGGTASKCEFARILIAEALVQRGHVVARPTALWGGKRTEDEKPRPTF